MILSFVHAVLDWFPWEVALTTGFVLFAVSWLFPRPVVSLPSGGPRRKTLMWAGTAGSLMVVAVAGAMSAINLVVYDASGFDGWWRRPAPLAVAILVVIIMALVLRRIPLPTPGERAITARRPWHAFSSRALLRAAGITAMLLMVTTLWQILIAKSAPEEGPFVGRILEYTLRRSWPSWPPASFCSLRPSRTPTAPCPPGPPRRP
jgi:hypothetical protein